MPVKFCTSNLNSTGTEVIFHSDESGFVYQHDIGSSFNGSNVVAEFQTPDMDYGDNGLRKSLYKVKVNIEPEGIQNDLNLIIKLKCLFYYLLVRQSIKTKQIQVQANNCFRSLKAKDLMTVPKRLVKASITTFQEIWLNQSREII